jgi:plasmid stabilization system protein ParE
LVVSERAEADLREIWLYSFKTWGEAQADRYIDELDTGLQECGADPKRGRQRDGVRPGYWSLLIRRHVAFYTFNSSTPASSSSTAPDKIAFRGRLTPEEAERRVAALLRQR